MKKLIIALAFGLITLTTTACRTENDQQNPKQTEKVNLAINMVKNGAVGINDTKRNAILCHTDYAKRSGSACVSIDGVLCSVEWYTVGYDGNNGAVRYYIGEEVADCQC